MLELDVSESSRDAGQRTYGRVVENKASRGVDRHCPSISSRVGDLASVKLDGVKLGLSGEIVRGRGRVRCR